jgi:hypothetical protein
MLVFGIRARFGANDQVVTAADAPAGFLIRRNRINNPVFSAHDSLGRAEHAFDVRMLAHENYGFRHRIRRSGRW